MTRPTERYHNPFHRAVRSAARLGAMKPLMASLVSVTVEGERNAEGLDGPLVVVANHSSHLDAPVLFSYLPRHITKNLATAAAADYFYKNKAKSALTGVFFNSYPVDRGGRKSKNAGMSVSLLRQGVPLLIFPEGTRSRTGQMKAFTPGAAAIARALRIPVLPVALVGHHEAMPVGASWPKAGRPDTKVLIGKPQTVRDGESLTDFNARIEAHVRAMYEARTASVIVPEGAPGAVDEPATDEQGHEGTHRQEDAS